MTQTVFKKTKISGISVVVPAKEICLSDEIAYFDNDPKKVERTRKMVGLYKRRVVDPDVTASDLCSQAAERLIRDMQIDVATIDALIFVVQNPDYVLPATACVIHNNLKLGANCLAFDINQGCAGYTYGLWVASSLIEGGNCKRVLLLAGDTASARNDLGNRITAPVFGDAGSATLLDYSDAADPSYYELGADGSGYEAIIAPASGSRIPVLYDEDANKALIAPIETEKQRTHLVDVYMDGSAIFNFTMTVVPPHIKSLMDFAAVTEKDISYLVLHQANKQIIQMVTDSLGFPPEKSSFHTVETYGNQTIASIPGAICDVLKDAVSSGKNRYLLSGFGVGLAWASCCLSLDRIYCSGVHDFERPSNHPTREEQIDKWVKKLGGR